MERNARYSQCPLSCLRPCWRKKHFLYVKRMQTGPNVFLNPYILKSQDGQARKTDLTLPACDIAHGRTAGLIRPAAPTAFPYLSIFANRFPRACSAPRGRAVIDDGSGGRARSFGCSVGQALGVFRRTAICVPQRWRTLVPNVPYEISRLGGLPGKSFLVGVTDSRSRPAAFVPAGKRTDTATRLTKSFVGVLEIAFALSEHNVPHHECPHHARESDCDTISLSQIPLHFFALNNEFASGAKSQRTSCLNCNATVHLIDTARWAGAFFGNYVLEFSENSAVLTHITQNPTDRGIHKM